MIRQSHTRELAKSTIEKQVQLAGPGAMIRSAAGRVLRINQNRRGRAIHVDRGSQKVGRSLVRELAISRKARQHGPARQSAWVARTLR